MSGVFIHMAVADVPPGNVAALIDACSSAVRAAGGCRLAPPAEGETPSAVVSVLIDAATTQAHLQVTLLSAQPTVRSYDISFRSADSASERFRTVGLAIASLVGDRVETRSIANAAPTVPPAAPVVAAATSASAASEVRDVPSSSLTFSPARWWLDGEAVVGRGALEAGPAMGAFVGATYHWPSTPWLLAVGASYTGQSASSYATSIREARAVLGAGASTGGRGRWGLEGRAQMLIDHLSVSGVSKVGVGAARQRWSGGLAASVTGACRLTDGLAIVGGFGVDWLQSPTQVTAYGENVLHIPALNGIANLGMRVALP